MDVIIILAASLATAIVVARRAGGVALADLMLGLFAGLAALGIASFVGAAGEWRLGLPLFFAVALAFGLEALRERPVWR
jgi:hypothetical protein